MRSNVSSDASMLIKGSKCHTTIKLHIRGAGDWIFRTCWYKTLSMCQYLGNPGPGKDGFIALATRTVGKYHTWFHRHIPSHIITHLSFGEWPNIWSMTKRQHIEMSFIVIRAVIWVHLAQWIYKINASQENSVI